MSLKRFIATRILTVIVSILAVACITFTLVHLMPGDPVGIYLGEHAASMEYVEMLRHKWGLDRPLHEQLYIYLRNIFLHGDFGESLHYNVPIFTLILERLPATLTLMISSLTFAILIGVLAGVFVSGKPNALLDGLVSGLTLFGFSVPTFWLGIMLIFAFSLQLKLFPVSGMVTFGKDIPYFIDVAWHVFLPTVTLGTHYLALYTRLTRTSMLEVLHQDFITTARSKGLKESTVLRRHALKNALLPIITQAGINFGGMFSGAVLTETVFGWPGVGRLAYEAIKMHEYALLSGIFIFVSSTLAVAILLSDILCAIVDPRIVIK